MFLTSYQPFELLSILDAWLKLVSLVDFYKDNSSESRSQPDQYVVSMSTTLSTFA